MPASCCRKPSVHYSSCATAQPACEHFHSQAARQERAPTSPVRAHRCICACHHLLPPSGAGLARSTRRACIGHRLGERRGLGSCLQEPVQLRDLTPPATATTHPILAAAAAAAASCSSHHADFNSAAAGARAHQQACGAAAAGNQDQYLHHLSAAGEFLHTVKLYSCALLLMSHLPVALVALNDCTASHKALM